MIQGSQTLELVESFTYTKDNDLEYKGYIGIMEKKMETNNYSMLVILGRSMSSVFPRQADTCSRVLQGEIMSLGPFSVGHLLNKVVFIFSRCFPDA